MTFFSIKEIKELLQKSDDEIYQAFEMKIQEQMEKLVSEGTVITFCCQAIKQPKRNLRGIIKEYGYPAGVAQRNLQAFGFSADPRVGDEFSAVIERWDGNAKMFNLKAPD